MTIGEDIEDDGKEREGRKESNYLGTTSIRTGKEIGAVCFPKVLLRHTIPWLSVTASIFQWHYVFRLYLHSISPRHSHGAI